MGVERRLNRSRIVVVTIVLSCLKSLLSFALYTKFIQLTDLLHCALSLAAQCIVIGPVCLCVCISLWVCLLCPALSDAFV